MRHYLESCNGHRVSVQAAPQSREELLDLIHQYYFSVAVGSSFRFVSTATLDISPDESYDIETLTLGLRKYSEDFWGLTEASIVGGGILPTDVHPTVEDLWAWLSHTVKKLRVEPSKLHFELERVDDFHVLQLSTDAKLLKSVTWNFPATTECYFRLPHPYRDDGAPERGV